MVNYRCLIISLLSFSAVISFASAKNLGGPKNFICNNPRANNAFAYLSGNIEGINDRYTIILRVWPKIIITTGNSENETPFKELKFVSENGNFLFKIDSLNSTSYFSLSILEKDSLINNRVILDAYLLSPGDSVSIEYLRDSVTISGRRYPHDSLRFYGRGSEKYKCIHSIKNIYFSYVSSSKPAPLPLKDFSFPVYGINIIKDIDNGWKERMRFELTYLKNYNGKIDQTCYNIIQSDIVATIWMGRLGSFNGNLESLTGLLDDSSMSKYNKEIIKAEIKKGYVFYSEIFSKQRFDSLLDMLSPVSQWFCDMVVLKYISDSVNLNHNSVYYSLKNDFKGLIRDRLIANYFLFRYFKIPNSYSKLQDALTYVRDKDCQNILQRFSRQQSGTKAYDFSLTGIDGQKHRLSDLKGKFVFIDFYFVGCGGCRYYYQEQVSKAELKFRNNNNIIFVAISIDKDKKKWEEGVSGGEYTAPHLPNVLNLYTESLGSEHPVIKYYNVLRYPHPMLIDRQGNIFSTDENELRYQDRGALIRAISKAIKK